MSITLRQGTLEDAKQCGEICYNAFKTISEQHNFPPDFPSPEIATALLSEFLAHPKIYGVVAELDCQIVGSNFVDERTVIAGIGPVTVDQAVQNHSVGRELMRLIMGRVAQQRFPGVRLVQAAYHGRSLSLYTKLGFVAREPLSTMQGSPLGIQIPGYSVRPATTGDLDACNQVCLKVHGHDRGGELLDAIKKGIATVVEHRGRITGYATSVAFFGHAVGETNGEIKAPHRGDAGVSRSRFSAPNPQRRAVPLVLGAGIARGPAADADERRPLQRACRSIPALDPLLMVEAPKRIQELSGLEAPVTRV